MEKLISFLVHFLAQLFLTSNTSKTNNNIKIQRVVSLNYVPNLLEKNTAFHLPYLTFFTFFFMSGLQIVCDTITNIDMTLPHSDLIITRRFGDLVCKLDTAPHAYNPSIPHPVVKSPCQSKQCEKGTVT